MAYTKQEKLTRCKLAAVYRIIDLYGWTQGIYNHVTVRLSTHTYIFIVLYKLNVRTKTPNILHQLINLPVYQVRISQDTEHFLLNPFGMLYNEITASSLVKVDMQGSVVEAGTTNFGVNVAGFMLHSAIHSARPDIKCILHIHTPAIVAVSIKFIY